MNTLQIILLPLIGAIIGAVTNELAIRMLFRPYYKKYFFKIPIPLTPGIIPKQHKIIAKNIAETFEKHLLSSQDLTDFLTNKNAQDTISNKIDETFNKLGPLATLASGFKPQIIKHINEAIQSMIDSEDTKKQLNIKQKIENKINEMDIATLEELILGFSRKQFRHITLFGAFLGGLIGLIQVFIINLI